MAEYFGAEFIIGCDIVARQSFPYLVKRVEPNSKFTLKEFKERLNDLNFAGGLKLHDEFLLRFLMARKGNIDDALALLTNYYSFRQKYPEIFRRLNAHDVLIHQALHDGFPGILPNRDRKGRKVILFLASRWNSRIYPLMTIYRALLLSLEHLICDELNQRRGFVVVVDWTEFSFQQSMNIRPTVLKTMVEGLQDSFPARFKGIHFLGQPWYVEAALALVKPFLKEKTKNKIFLHGNNLGKFHEHVPSEILPPELGGEGPSFDPLIWAETLLQVNRDQMAVLPDDELTPYEPQTIT